MLSLYIHVPFCRGKCPYCDFYSRTPQSGEPERYLAAVERRLAAYGAALHHPAVHTVYFGGGTPSVLGAAGLGRLIRAARAHFSVLPDAEITAEANPADVTPSFADGLLQAGFNRLSLGVQSGNDAELRLLGRRHTAAGAKSAVEIARAAGFSNISVDLMLALPGSDTDSLARSVEFVCGLRPEHISAYILKIEPGTVFASRQPSLALPDADAAADQYLRLVSLLSDAGYAQYEISNFCHPGRESRHNLQYWRLGEYLGIGPAAHSFVNGRRFYFPRDLSAFLRGGAPKDDGPGGDFSEFAMLALRLSEGLSREKSMARYADGGACYDAVLRQAMKLPAPLFARRDAANLSFSAEGFLVSNAVLASVLPDEI